MDLDPEEAAALEAATGGVDEGGARVAVVSLRDFSEPRTLSADRIARIRAEVLSRHHSLRRTRGAGGSTPCCAASRPPPTPPTRAPRVATLHGEPPARDAAQPTKAGLRTLQFLKD